MQVICRHLIEKYWQYSSVFAEQKWLVLILLILYFCWLCSYLLWLKVQYKSLLQTCPLDHSLKQNYDIAFAFPKENQCQKQLSALKTKNPPLPVGCSLPSSSVLCTSPRLKRNNGKITQFVHMEDFSARGGSYPGSWPIATTPLDFWRYCIYTENILFWYQGDINVPQI